MKAVRETLSPHGRRRGKAGQAETLRHKGLPSDGTLESLASTRTKTGDIIGWRCSYGFVLVFLYLHNKQPRAQGYSQALEYMDASSLDVLKKGAPSSTRAGSFSRARSTATSNRTSSPTARWCCGKTTAETAACRTHSRCPSSKIPCVSMKIRTGSCLRAGSPTI